MKKLSLLRTLTLSLMLMMFGMVNAQVTGYQYQGATTPVAPTVNGDVINVTAANAQYVLDGAYGAIDGKTINFTETISDKLVLGRPTKYAGSNTVYRHGSFSNNPLSYTEFIAYKTQSGWTEYSYYNRAISNVTFTANEGVTVAGFTSCGGAHVSGTTAAPIYDYVRDNGIWCYDTNNGYFVYVELKNFKFNGLTFTGKTDINTSSDATIFDNFEFIGCKFNLNNTNEQAIRYYSEGVKGNVKNLVVKNCEFNKVNQAVYVNKVVNVDIENNTVTTTGHNAFAFQNSYASDPAFGNVIIKNNTIRGCGDRAIRFNYVNAPTAIAIIGNTASYGDGTTPSDENAIKATSIAAGVLVVAKDNNWNNFSDPSNNEFKDADNVVSLEVSQDVNVVVETTATDAEKAAANNTVKNIDNNVAVIVANATNVASVAEINTLIITVQSAAVETAPATATAPAAATVTKVTFDVQPMNGETKVYELDDELSFRLPVPASFKKELITVKHVHNGVTQTSFVEVKGTGANKYIELASNTFSEWSIEDTDIYTRNVTNGNYGTICLPYASSGISGMTLYSILDICEQGLYIEELQSNYMEAGVPYIFKATSSTISVELDKNQYEEEAGEVSANGVALKGSYVEQKIAYNAYSPNYILSGNQLHQVLGDYVYVGEYRAYIHLGAGAPARLNIVVRPTNPIVTGVEEATAAKASKALVNGKLVIKKGAHTFNANGAMLK